MQVDIKADIAAARRRLSDAQRRIIPAATNRALNRTGDHANTLTVRELSGITGLKQKDVRAAMQRTRSNFGNLTYRLAAIGRALNLIRFSARQTQKGVTATAWGKRKLYKGTFIANQGRTVFVRESKARLPIKAVHGPSLPREFARVEFMAKLKESVTVKWRAEFSAQLNYYLNKGK